jgi:hypothetical protein
MAKFLRCAPLRCCLRWHRLRPYAKEQIAPQKHNSKKAKVVLRKGATAAPREKTVRVMVAASARWCTSACWLPRRRCRPWAIWPA